MIIMSETAEASLAGLGALRLRFARAAADLRLPGDLTGDLTLAIAEIGANAIRHAEPKPKKISLSVSAGSHGLTATLSDDGGIFDEFAGRWSALDRAPADPLEEGGRGLWLARAATDALTYSTKDGNVWTLTRRYLRGKPSLLVIEDDETTLALYHAILGEDHLLTTARSIKETLALGDLAEFDLIVADYHIKDGNCFDLLAGIDAKDSGLLMPVIIVSADTSAPTAEAAARIGAQALLAKPLRFRETRSAVTQALNAAAAQKVRQARQFLATLDGLTPFCRCAEAHGLRIEARRQNAGIGGGDLFFDLGGSARRRFVLADLMGHGLKAQARAAQFSGMLSGLRNAWAERPPGEFVNALSDALHQSGLEDRLTGTVLVIDCLENGELQLASGGHPAPALFGPQAARELALTGHLPGLAPSAQAETLTLRLAPGERLAAVTDGIAPDASSILASMPQDIRALLQSGLSRPIETAAAEIEQAISSGFRYRPGDDWTFMLIGRSADS